MTLQWLLVALESTQLTNPLANKYVSCFACDIMRVCCVLHDLVDTERQMALEMVDFDLKSTAVHLVCC